MADRGKWVTPGGTNPTRALCSSALLPRYCQSLEQTDFWSDVDEDAGK